MAELVLREGRTVAVEVERVVSLASSPVLLPGLIKSKRDPVEVLPDSVVDCGSPVGD